MMLSSSAAVIPTRVWTRPRPRVSALVCALIGAAGLALTPALVMAGGDEGAPRPRLNVAKARSADLLHMDLSVMIADMNTPRLVATQRLTFRPLGEPVTVLRLDARDLTIRSAQIEGRVTTFTYDGQVLSVMVTPALTGEETATLVTSYEVDSPELGLTWTPESATPARAAQLHSQGQPETNSYWFPTHDFPNEKLTTELTITVPRGYVALSNGRLASQNREIVRNAGGGMTPYDRFQFVQSQPHSPYLVSLVVGKFNITDVGVTIPMPVYVPVEMKGDVQGSFGRTQAMADYFGKRFDEPYPWDKYAQAVVYNFAWGGMENTSATTLVEGALYTKEALADSDPDDLVSHELAHQWFGNLLTCDSWEHIWLNEGLATYSTALWMGERDGPLGYERQVRLDMDSIIKADVPDAPSAQGMASPYYDHPDDVFGRAASPYAKGSSVLHMLRVRMGDEVFFRGIAEFIDRHKFETVATEDFRAAMERASGEDLKGFFEQWVTRPGVPTITVKPVWDAAARTLRVSVTQIQPMNAENPPFQFDLPVWVRSSGGSASTVMVPVRGAVADASFLMDNEPDLIAVDPWMSVLADIRVELDEQRLMKQATEVPSLAGKIAAVRDLAQHTSARSSEFLRRVGNDRALPWLLRAEAARALAARGDEVDLRSLFTGAGDRWELREATATAMGDLLENQKRKVGDAARASIAQYVAERAIRDPSSRVRVSCIRTLARVGAVEHLPTVVAGLNYESHGNRVRNAALNALGQLKQPEGLKHAIAWTREGVEPRTRAAANAAVGELGGFDKDAALAALTPQLTSRIERVRQSAGEALVALGDARAIEAMQAARETFRAGVIKDQFIAWEKSLGGSAASSPAK